VNVFLQVKLEEALTVATDFHDSLQDFINWLTQAEQTLTMVSPASLIMDTVMFQIDEHKVRCTRVPGPQFLPAPSWQNGGTAGLITLVAL
jgi:hypothetical protein